MTATTLILVIVVSLVAVPIVLGLLRMLIGVGLLALAWSIGGFAEWYEKRLRAKMNNEKAT